MSAKNSNDKYAQEVEFLRHHLNEISANLEDRIVELSVIKELGGALEHINDFAKTCETILQVVIKHTLAQNFSIMMLDEDKNQLYLVSASDPENKSFIINPKDILGRRNLQYSFRHGHGVAGVALEKREPILVADVDDSPYFTNDITSNIHIGSMLSVPMFCQGKDVGVLNISHRQRNIFDINDIHLFNILADIIALLLQSSLDLYRLRISEERYRIITENSNDGITILHNGRHQYSNPKYQQITGYTEKELKSKTFEDLLNTSVSENFAYQGITENSHEGKLIKAVLVAKDGHNVDVEINISAIEHEGKEATILSIRDMSYRRQLERQLRQFQKMEAIGTLAGGVAHDFNNILAAIIGYTDLAYRKSPEDSQVRSYLEETLKAGERAKNLVKQILAFSRQTEQENQSVQVDLVIKEALKLLRATLPSSVEIKHDITPECLVIADPTQIHQLLMNLCINASHAMQENGGILEVSLQRKDINGGHPEMLELRKGKYVLLSVKDTGHGMDASLMEKIFDPYFTTKEKGVGTGMGLAVVHGIVKSLAGYIKVESKPGKGSLFEVYLPRVTQQKLKETASLSDVPRGTEHILLIDDEEALTRMGEEMLCHLGYTVTTENSSVDALKLFQEQPDQFDLIITDEGMPKMSGKQLVKEVLKIRPGMPVILCTGFSDSLDIKKPHQYGLKQILMKPLLVKDLAQTIRIILDNPANPRN